MIEDKGRRRFNAVYKTPAPKWWQKLLRIEPEPKPVMVEVQRGTPEYDEAQFEELIISGTGVAPFAAISTDPYRKAIMKETKEDQ